MGVPKFFRYTSERYPCLNELVKQYQIPDFDNMYLDMNGIIHNCSHPDDSDPHFRITEEKIFSDIFHYLEILFQIIKPKKLFFMAIDGVAPRAKMNQQRGRRFRSAREAEKLEELAKKNGEVLPTEKRFDSNCITPGTVFMARLHEQLRFFVKRKITSDPLWSKVKVILSGHETPGEGEHKIMDYIRWARSQPEYEPNTRHCLYGLDADLIMLGVCTHEPHFALLREEVKFGRNTQRATSPEETNFFLLHLSLLREYLEQEFIDIKDKLKFPYDIEKIVDDWVLMGFLVGNDFIPNLPNMHINNDALPLLYKTYMAVLPTLDGYINEAGDLHLGRFETFMQELAKIDMETFQQTYTDLKYFVAKTGRRPNAAERKEYKPNNDETFNVDLDDIKANKPDAEMQALIDATENMFKDDIEDDDDDDEYEDISDDAEEEDDIHMEFMLHKKDYYMNKLDYSKVTKEVLVDQAEGYVRAIQWNLWYYYRGCASWCWYYPHHYAPYISDIKGFKDLKIEFELGDPFKPFEQLLAVLPAASKQLLPAPFHELMTDEDSPIVHYYPLNFETDLNGKKNDWEAVVLIPFIDEVNLLSAMAPCYQRLTEEETKRNTHGPMLVYNWSQQSLGVVTAPEYYPPIADSHAVETKVLRQDLEVPFHLLKRGMLPNARRDILYPGFPTMRHLKYTTSMLKAKVKVFDTASRNENMIVELERRPAPALEQAARELLGRVVWVGWPHLTSAKVISVSNEKQRIHLTSGENNNTGSGFSTEINAGNLHKQWISERSTVIEHNMNRLGIELGDVQILIHALNLRGYKYVVQDNCQMVEEPEWCSIPCGYAYQAVVADVGPQLARPPLQYSTPKEAYPEGDTVFLLTQGPYYGAQATVVDASAIRSGRIKVSVRERAEPAAQRPPPAALYRPAHHAAAASGLSVQMLSRITGTVLVVPGERSGQPTETLNKINLGLNLKFNKKNQEVAGYTRRDKESGVWTYSARCVAAVHAYVRHAPELFDRLASAPARDVYFEGDLWPDQVGKNKAQEMLRWLKAQPHSKACKRECGSDALEPEDMVALCRNIQAQLAQEQTEKKVTLQVKWSLLYKSELHSGNIPPDPAADFRLLDRVVCCARNIGAPCGAAGTVTAVHPPPLANTVRLSDSLNACPTYQVMFDEPFPGGMTEELFTETRFYRMLPTNMLSLSYGRKLRSAARDDALEPHYDALRRHDGHSSAFANYSPPADYKPVTILERNPSSPRTKPMTRGPPPKPNIGVPAAQTQDNATHLLKSLLKISETDTAPKKNKKPEPEQNWRARSDPPPPHAQHRQNHKLEEQQTWRRAQQVPPFVEWTNANNGFAANNHKQQAHQQKPPAMFMGNHGNQPYFGPPFGHQPPHAPGGPMPPFPPFGNGPLRDVFPAHLPSVQPSAVPMPCWVNQDTKPAGSSQPHASADKLSNPFVPLQVQTSQRRNSNKNSAPSRKKDTEESAPNTSISQPQPTVPSAPPQNTQTKPVKKRKPRIAANLPFQMD